VTLLIPLQQNRGIALQKSQDLLKVISYPILIQTRTFAINMEQLIKKYQLYPNKMVNLMVLQDQITFLLKSIGVK
jgi:hypothetical protein